MGLFQLTVQRNLVYRNGEGMVVVEAYYRL